MTFMMIPIRTMTVIGMAPLANTIAFGGVATGNMKAHEADIVAGIMRRNGCTSSPTAVAARIGRKIVAIAVFDVISVRNVTMSAETTTRSTAGAPANKLIPPAIFAASPLSRKPLPRAIPPPNSISIPHGISFAAFQSRTNTPRFASTGRMKRTIAAATAIVES